MHPRRKTVGLRVPDNNVSQALLREFGEPIMSTSLLLPGDEEQITDPYEMRLRLGKLVDLIIDAGACGLEPTTMIDLVEGFPIVMRSGKGDPQPFL
jgi:tRNA threonylcarbamoyl adenosine modification protein (Sua5/YciO/YrdC/YwlC family)